MATELNTNTLIIGAGISGLATAHFLKQKGVKSIILEKEGQPGGSIRSERIDGFLVEYGPNSTLDTSPIIHELLAGVRLESEMEYANEKSNNRYIVRDGRLNALPMKPGAFLKTPHFSAGAKMRLLKEPFISAADPEKDESLAEFVQRRLGREFLDYAIDPFVAGVYAGLPENLSVKSAFPKLYDLEQKYGSLIKGAVLGARERKKRREVSKQSARLFSFPDGLQTVIDALQQEFADDIFLNSKITGMAPAPDGGYRVTFQSGKQNFVIEADQIILTIPAHAYSSLPGEIFQPMLPELEKIYYPPVTMVYFGYKENPAPRPLDGFGYLIPRVEGFKILGTIWSSSIFSKRAPEGGIALTTFVGGSRQPEIALQSEQEITKTVKADLDSLMGIQKEPDLAVVKKWEKAIPQYQVGHQQIITAVEDFERTHPGIVLSGNFRGGISLGDCIKQAKSIAEKAADASKIVRNEAVVAE